MSQPTGNLCYFGALISSAFGSGSGGGVFFPKRSPKSKNVTNRMNPMRSIAEAVCTSSTRAGRSVAVWATASESASVVGSCVLTRCR